MKRYVALVALGLLLLAPALASASIQAVGEPLPSQSWVQGFNESGVGFFDLVVVKMVSMGDSFESFTHYGFSGGSWALAYENAIPYPTLAYASGSAATTNLTWTIRFAGESSNPLNFDFVAFNGNQIAESANADWNGSGWTFTSPGNWFPSRSSIVPEPVTIIIWSLLGSIVIGLGWWRKRKAT